MEVQPLKGYHVHLSKSNPSYLLSNPIIRTISGLAMAVGFIMVIYMGPVPIFICNILSITKSFDELLQIGLKSYKCRHLWHVSTLSWFLYLLGAYAFIGQSIYDEFGHDLQRHIFLKPIIKYHGLLCFSFYTFGLVFFVAKLDKLNYFKQYSMLGYVHLCTGVLVIPDAMSIKYFSKGLIWFLLPLTTIIFNDVAAYIIGSVCGRHKLIEVSPKKTWEGFLGALMLSLVFGYSLSAFMCKFNYFLCPIKYDYSQNLFVVDQCQIGEIFRPRIFTIAENVKISIEPFQFHAFAFSFLASTLGPFGGFIASGFKRAYDIKDFGNTIPGHGGILDRLDCQFLYQTFIYFYINYIIYEPIGAVNYQIFLTELKDKKFNLLNTQF